MMVVAKQMYSNSQHVQYEGKEKKAYVCMCSVSVLLLLFHCLHALARQHANAVLQICNQGTLTASSTFFGVLQSFDKD